MPIKKAEVAIKKSNSFSAFCILDPVRSWGFLGRLILTIIIVTGSMEYKGPGLSSAWSSSRLDLAFPHHKAPASDCESGF